MLPKIKACVWHLGLSGGTVAHLNTYMCLHLDRIGVALDHIENTSATQIEHNGMGWNHVEFTLAVVGQELACLCTGIAVVCSSLLVLDV